MKEKQICRMKIKKIIILLATWLALPADEVDYKRSERDEPLLTFTLVLPASHVLRRPPENERMDT